MNAFGWISVALTTLFAVWGLVRLKQALERKVILGAVAPGAVLPAMGLGFVAAVVFVGIAVVILSALTAGA